jgi:hypothetical protein
MADNEAQRAPNGARAGDPGGRRPNVRLGAREGEM